MNKKQVACSYCQANMPLFVDTDTRMFVFVNRIQYEEKGQASMTGFNYCPICGRKRSEWNLGTS
ncbi:hypothetical protein M8332_07130 (plasmid) [Fructilactobacillus ixorae]|uniref:Uncharacterized protein n=1 Tax=Fructilactobacillus ixorae TaxID=1750535 RepID=A0ABY5C7I7_9LACO|nr:hypothetical protein [Fructilactobacillus ixorae]USS93989.1 hypothetical protein M8332_07130 [Fructilactobacillus ixorae]